MAEEMVRGSRAGGCGGNHSGFVAEIGRACPEDSLLEKLRYYPHGGNDVALE